MDSDSHNDLEQEFSDHSDRYTKAERTGESGAMSTSRYLLWNQCDSRIPRAPLQTVYFPFIGKIHKENYGDRPRRSIQSPEVNWSVSKGSVQQNFKPPAINVSPRES